MMDALTLVVITEDMCVYNDTPGSEGYGTYTVSIPELPELPEGLSPIVAVSGLFKDTNGDTHRLETLTLQYDEDNDRFNGTWEESGIPYILRLLFDSPTEGTIIITRSIG